MVDILNLSANERVDLNDLQYASFGSQFAFHRLQNAQMMSGGSSLWVLSGFVPSSSAQQLTVTLGVALLAYRTGVTVQYGVIAAEGDAQKVLDLSGYPAGVYGIYIRFNYAQSGLGSRTFWSTANSGSEYAKTVPTRQSAVWELRVEAANPGAEYLQIGQATVGSGTLAVVDQRPMYFEGSVQTSYANTWGAGNDRSANRALYGVHDFQTFTAAMRQGLEDVKGVGLRRWWAADIGGQCIGFVGTPIEDRTAWGDANFFAQGSTTRPYLSGDGNSLLAFDRPSATWLWGATATPQVALNAVGVGIGTSTPVNALSVAGSMALGTFASTAIAGSGNFAASGSVLVGTTNVSGDLVAAVGSNATYVTELLSNTGTGGAALRLASAAREWRLRVTAATGGFALYDSTAAAARMTFDGSGYGNVPVGLLVGNAGTPVSPLQAYAGSLGSAAASLLEASRMTAAASTDTDNLRTLFYRTSAASALAATADLYVQRITNAAAAGFTCYSGGGAAGSNIAAAGVGLGYGAPGTLPTLMVTSGGITYINNVGSGYATSFSTNTSYPLQMACAYGGAAFFSSNLGGAPYSIFGYSNGYAYDGTHAWNGTVIGSAYNGGANIYFINNNMYCGGVKYNPTYPSATPGAWIFADDSTFQPSMALHVRSIGNLGPGLYLDGTGTSLAASLRIGTAASANQGAIEWYNAANYGSVPAKVFSLAYNSNGGNIWLYDVAQGVFPWYWTGSSKQMDLSGAATLLATSMQATSLQLATASSLTCASTAVTQYNSPLDFRPGGATAAYYNDNSCSMKATTTSANASRVSMALKVPRNMTITGITVSGVKSGGVSSTLTLGLVSSNTGSASGTTLATLTSAATTNGSLTLSTGAISFAFSEATNNILTIYLVDSDSSATSLFTINGVTVTYNVTSVIPGIRG